VISRIFHNNQKLNRNSPPKKQEVKIKQNQKIGKAFTHSSLALAAFDGAARDTGGHLLEANGLAHPSQGKAASAAAALGCGRKSTRSLKGCPINQPNDAPALMKQAFSLPSIYRLFPQGLALG
jgi:hypothetical protein